MFKLKGRTNLLAQHVRAAAKFSDGWPHFWVQIWTPKSFSFLLLGLCLGPVLGSRFGPKSGVSHRRILLLPAEVLQADFWRTSMSASVNTCFFSLCVPLCFLYSSNRTWDAQREKGMSWHSCSSWRVAQICLHNMCGQQRNSPMADPIFGSKYGPQNGVQNWITFSFLLLGLCLGPVLGSRFGPKSGVSHRRILLLPAEVLQADFWRTSMSASVNTCFFLSASHFVSCTVRVPFWPPCFYWFFGSCFGSLDEAGLLAFEALQGLPRPARGTHGRSYCARNQQQSAASGC